MGMAGSLEVACHFFVSGGALTSGFRPACHFKINILFYKIKINFGGTRPADFKLKKRQPYEVAFFLNCSATS